MDDQLKKIRIRVVVVIGAFVGIILILSLIVFIVNTDRSLPADKTRVPRQENQQQNQVVRIFGLENLINYGLSSSQINRVYFSLSSFVDQNNLKYIAIDSSTIKTSFNSNSNIIGFKATSDTDKVFRVECDYVTTVDIMVRVYDGNKLVFGETFDFHD